MRVGPDGTVVLSRRNLITLLAKLDGFPADSACTLLGGDDAHGLVVKAEEDDVHYGSRGYPAGYIHPATRQALDRYQPPPPPRPEIRPQ